MVYVFSDRESREIRFDRSNVVGTLLASAFCGAARLGETYWAKYSRRTGLPNIHKRSNLILDSGIAQQVSPSPRKPIPPRKLRGQGPRIRHLQPQPQQLAVQRRVGVVFKLGA